MGRIPRPVHTVNISASPRERGWGRGVPGWVWEAVSGGLDASRAGDGLRDATRYGGLWRPPAVSPCCGARSRECGRRRRWSAHPVTTGTDERLAVRVSRCSVYRQRGRRRIGDRHAQGTRHAQQQERESVDCSPTASVATSHHSVTVIFQVSHEHVTADTPRGLTTHTTARHVRFPGSGVTRSCW